MDCPDDRSRTASQGELLNDVVSAWYTSPTSGFTDEFAKLAHVRSLFLNLEDSSDCCAAVVCIGTTVVVARPSSHLALSTTVNEVASCVRDFTRLQT